MATAENQVAAHKMAIAILYAQAYGGDMPTHPLVPDDEIILMAEEWDGLEGIEEHPDYGAECLKLIESYTPIKDR